MTHFNRKFFIRHLGHRVLAAWAHHASATRKERNERKMQAQYDRAMHWFKNHLLLKAWPAWCEWLVQHKVRKDKLKKAHDFWGKGVLQVLAMLCSNLAYVIDSGPCNLSSWQPLFDTWRRNVAFQIRRRHRLVNVFINVCEMDTFNSSRQWLQVYMVRTLADRATKLSVWEVWQELYQYRLQLWEKVKFYANHSSILFFISFSLPGMCHGCSTFFARFWYSRL
jgi:hypothetical protein